MRLWQEGTPPIANARYLIAVDLMGEHVHDRSYVTIAAWDGEAWRSSHAGYTLAPQPRHWMELPPLPVSASSHEVKE